MQEINKSGKFEMYGVSAHAVLLLCCHNSKNFNQFEFPAKTKISILKKLLVILTSSSSLQASDLFWPDICGDLVKIRHGELQSERDQVILFFKF